MGRLLIAAGVVLVLVGLLVQMGLPLGRLPGDIRIERPGLRIYLPIASCLVVSAVLSPHSGCCRAGDS